MTEKQTELGVEEEVVETNVEEPKQSKKDEIKAKQAYKIDKYLKQENFTTKSGKELTVTFPGTEEAQDLLDDANSNEYQEQSLSSYRMHVLYLDKILEDNLTIEDFEKEMRKKKKSFEIEDSEGKKAKYTLQFPKIGAFEQQVDLRESTGRSKSFTKLILQQVLTKPLTIKYFDTHSGYLQVIAEANKFLTDTYNNSEYKEVVDYIDDFVGRMFL